MGNPSNADWTAVGDQCFDAFGIHVGWAGDVNGDGCDDFMVGHHGYDVPGSDNVGRTAIWFGTDASFTSGNSPEYADIIIVGEQANCYSGQTLSTAGDIDGDGFDDIIVGAIHYNGGLEDEGKLFGFRGSPVLFLGNFETGDLHRWTSSSP